MHGLCYRATFNIFVQTVTIMSTINIKLYDFVKQELKLSDEKAREFVEIIDEAVKEDVRTNTNEYKSLWKEDFYLLDKRILESKNDMYKAMFVSGVVQLIAILGGVLAIVKFIVSK